MSKRNKPKMLEEAQALETINHLEQSTSTASGINLKDLKAVPQTGPMDRLKNWLAPKPTSKKSFKTFSKQPSQTASSDQPLEQHVDKTSSLYTRTDIQNVIDCVIDSNKEFVHIAVKDKLDKSACITGDNQLCQSSRNWSFKTPIDYALNQSDNKDYRKQNQEKFKIINDQATYSHKSKVTNLPYNLSLEIQEKGNRRTAGDCNNDREGPYYVNMSGDVKGGELETCASKESSQAASKRNTVVSNLPSKISSKHVGEGTSPNKDFDEVPVNILLYCMKNFISSEQILLSGSQSNSKNLDHFRESGISIDFKQDSCPNRSKGFLNEESLLQAVDEITTRGKLFASKLRSLPEEKLEEAEMQILNKLDQFEMNIHQGKSMVTPEQVTVSSAINKWQTDDPFEAKGMVIAKQLGNLPKDISEKVKSSILHILYQFQTDIHQGISEKEVNVQHESSEHINQPVLLTRQPIPRMAKVSVAQPSYHNSPRTRDSYKTRKEAELNPSNHGPPLDSEIKTAFEFSNPTSLLYPSDSLNDMKAYLCGQDHMEYENGQADDSLSFEEKEEDSIIPPPQTSSTVKHRGKPIPVAEECPDRPCYTTRHTTQKTSKPLMKPTPTKSDSGYTALYGAIGFLVTVLVIVLVSILYYKNGLSSLQIPSFLGSNTVSKTSPSSPQIDIGTIMDNLKQDFNEQPSMTFKMVKTAINTLNRINPKEPAIIALLAEKGAEDVSSRFARQLAESISSYRDVVTISGRAFSEQDPDTAKKAIDDSLNRGLKENTLGAVFVDRLDYIPGDAALIFHTYCDHENAPFKRVVYVMTVVSDQTHLGLVEPKEWDTKFQEHLYKSWSVLGVDQISSLMSRLTVRVAAIIPKDKG